MIEASVLDFLAQERRRALSPREWRFRVMGYGYGVRDEGGRQVVTKLPQGTMLGVLPADFA
ncbi:MAG: hypothetical protein EP307_03190 [Rhodobacteraceae bacterium]|nr:MAG: hypothetical protein EP307_03190 [Paracoccaceae bacterium]